MKQISMQNKTYGSLKRAMIMGITVGFIITFVLILIAAAVIIVKDVSPSAINPITTVAAAVGAFFSGFTASRINKTRGLVVGTLCGITIFLLLTIIGIFINGFNFSAQTLIRFVILIISSIIGGVMGVNARQKTKFNFK